MPTVTVTAINTFPYGDRIVQRGDRVEVRPIDALVLARQGNVSLTRGYQVRVLEPEVATEPEPKPRRRRYRRRDLTADTA